MGVDLPFPISDHFRLILGIHNFQMAHMGAVVVKVSADGGFSLLDIAWIRRWASNDERSKAGNADLDALGHICMFYGTDN
jgi:hypothetical protein